MKTKRQTITRPLIWTSSNLRFECLPLLLDALCIYIVHPTLEWVNCVCTIWIAIENAMALHCNAERTYSLYWLNIANAMEIHPLCRLHCYCLAWPIGTFRHRMEYAECTTWALCCSVPSSLSLCSQANIDRPAFAVDSSPIRIDLRRSSWTHNEDLIINYVNVRYMRW